MKPVHKIVNKFHDFMNKQALPPRRYVFDVELTSKVSIRGVNPEF